VLRAFGEREIGMTERVGCEVVGTAGMALETPVNGFEGGAGEVEG
jgi:hypothetical protein